MVVIRLEFFANHSISIVIGQSEREHMLYYWDIILQFASIPVSVYITLTLILLKHLLDFFFHQWVFLPN